MLSHPFGKLEPLQLSHGVPGEEGGDEAVLQRLVHLPYGQLLQLPGEEQRILEQRQLGGRGQQEGGAAQLLKWTDGSGSAFCQGTVSQDLYTGMQAFLNNSLN